MKKTLCALSLLLAVGMAPMMSGTAAPAKKAPAKPAAVQKVAPAKPAPATDKAKGIIDTSYREVQSLNLLQNPDQWVGQAVSFEGTFITFSPYALDYKPAMRASKDYIAFMVQRPDVDHHVIPLSELKLIFPRKKADSVMDLESGDKVLVKGKVFSAALGDPWVDVDDVVILQKSPENLAKGKSKAKAKKNPDLE